MYKAIISIGYMCVEPSGLAELEQLRVDQTVSVVNIILATSVLYYKQWKFKCKCKILKY